jgi:putative transposase
VDDYLATNIPEEIMSHEEIAEAYRRAIEVLWKFLKTHLRLDKMMSKNLNGMTMQIDAILIVYLLWQLYAYGTATPIEIPRIYGSK